VFIFTRSSNISDKPMSRNWQTFSID